MFVAGRLKHWRHDIWSRWSLRWWTSTYVSLLYWTGLSVISGRHWTRGAVPGTAGSQRQVTWRTLAVSTPVTWKLWVLSMFSGASALKGRSSWDGFDRERHRIWRHLRALWWQACCCSLPCTFYRAGRTLLPAQSPALAGGPLPSFSSVRLHLRKLCYKLLLSSIKTCL